MERRRRALGLKKPSVSPEKNAPRSSRRMNNISENLGSNPEDKSARGKASDRGQPTCSVTPKQKTPVTRHNLSESPCSPMQSPSSQMLFPGTLASPEIEVSWDWSCSQVPKEMLPPKKSKRAQDAKAQKPVLPAINMCSLRPRHPIQQRMTEEEKKQRLDYFKQILSFKSEGSPTHILDTTNNNNLEDMSIIATKSFNTPKRPNTRLSSSSKKKQDNNSLFDDSANEFMLECSQAIEDKLKSGEIDMGPIVDIKISQAKRSHSPNVNNGKLNKKICHGRVNLFPDNDKPDNKNLNERFGRNCIINSNCTNSDTKLSHEMLNRPTCNRSSKNVTVQSQNSCDDRLDSRTTFSKHDTGKNDLIKPNNADNFFGEDDQSSLKPPNCSSLTKNGLNVPKQKNSSESCGKEMQRLNSNLSNRVHSNTSDVSSLLDDDFNMELSSLDVDSLCRSSENSQAVCTSGIDSAPRQCTQQEIEAKRLAALRKLMMKRKR